MSEAKSPSERSERVDRIVMRDIYTEDQIETACRKCGGTWVKRRNLRKRMKQITNQTIDRLIAEKRKTLRSMISKPESEKRAIYSEITQLEIQKHEC